MDDDSGFSISFVKKTSKKKTLASDFDVLDSQPWYHDYEEISNSLIVQLESLHTQIRDNAIRDVVQFVSNYQYTVERVPLITLFTGFNLPDHSSMISMLAENLEKDKDINCHMVNLNSTKTSSLKTLIESVVYDFVNNISEKRDDSFEEDESDNVVIAKSKCSLLRLTDWYLNNYGSLDELNESDNDCEVTHLVIVIQDIGTFPKQILNDFLKTISAFRDRLPFMFLIGVPYTLNTLEKRFTSEVYSKVAIYPFQSQPSVAFLDRVLEEVILSERCVFHMGPDVFRVLGHSYTNYNYSIKEFIKGAKLCVMEHFSRSPAHATFCCDPETNSISDRIDNLTDNDVALILDLPSMQKYNSIRKMKKQPILTVSSATVKDELKKLYDGFNIGMIRFNAAVQCLNLLMKSLKDDSFVTPIQEIYMNVMDSERRQKWLTTNLMYIGHSSKHSLLQALKKVENMLSGYKESELTSIRSKLSTFINQIEQSQPEQIKNSPSRSPISSAIRSIRTPKSPLKAAISPIKATRSPVKATRSPMKATRSPLKPKSPFEVTKTPVSAIRSPLVAANSPSTRGTPLACRALFRDNLKTSACKDKLHNEYVETRKELLYFLEHEFLKLYLKSVDDIPLRELFIYNDHETILGLLNPSSRTALNNALETPGTYLECNCCNLRSRDEVLKTMPDLSIVFKLHKECGNIINLCDWFQQFRFHVDKKHGTDDYINPEIYARFSLAMKELHFLGYISLPKKKPNGVEYVTKLAFF